MARRKQDPFLQKLRRMARAGHRREAVAMLEEAVQANPSYTKAREELARYLTGKPFSFEETDYKELQSIISDFTSSPQRVNEMKKTALKKLKHRTCYLEQALSHMLSATDKKALQQLRAAISREQQRRRRPLNKVYVGLAASLTVLLALGGTGFFLWQRAGRAADIMCAAANRNFQRSKARQLLNVHDTGLNRTLNRRVGEQSERLRVLIRASEQRAAEVDAILRTIEKGEQSVVGQGVRKRALVERRLRELGADATDLQLRWAELCRKEQSELNQQRLSLVEELLSPLPEWQGLKGEMQEDLRLLEDRMKKLRQRMLIYEDAAEALNLPESIIAKVKQEVNEHKLQLKEIRDYRNMLDLLPNAHDYPRYQQLLLGFKAEHYAPAIAAMEIVEQMPSVASVRGMMQEHGQNLPSGLLQAAKASLVDGKPTFSTTFPANMRQLQLLDELQSNRALSTRLYELTNTADNEEAYSEALPVLRYGRACFERSSLDPERDITESKSVEWQNPAMVVSRTLNPRPLFEALGLDNKTGFKTTVNLPASLTRVLQHEHPDVPPLAKAYVFYHLIQANNSGSQPILSGLRYAPEMRKVLESFEKLRQSCGVKLDGNCWLRRTPAHTEAEKKYARWFNKNRKADFARELSRNLNALLSVTPRFCGYVNEQGEAVLFEQLNQGQLIWYLSDAAMTTTSWGSPLQKPMLLSPVFAMEKLH